MKKLILSILFFSTQTLMAHPDCVFNNAPIGGIGTKVSSDRVDNAIIATTIKAKEKLDELIRLFNRSSSRKISVLSAVDTKASVEAPLVFSPTTIAKDLEKLKLTMSPMLKKVLFEDGRTNLSQISEVDIKKYGDKISGLYDLAIRYELLSRNKSYYVGISHKDVRGFHFFLTKKMDAQILKDFNNFDEKTQGNISDALFGICKNSKVKSSTCRKEVKKAVQSNTVHVMYSKYINEAITNWNTFFLIPNSATRKDITYRNGILEVPFSLPENKNVHDFVRTIEKTWDVRDLRVELDFRYEKDIPNISFKENSVAHVNKLGGNNIVMNTITDMNEETAQFTLSHEFGHVLGLPDCYIEFFDEEKAAFVNYQLFKSDMMCSVRGKLTARIQEEIKRVYKR